MRWITQVGNWFDRRLQLAAPIREAAEHPVPRNTASWWYVFGSAALTVFILQLVTGILLALVYVPSASEAWNSLQALNHDVTLGWFTRALHGWGSNFMVAVVLIHMVQVFLFGAHKFPRELTWIIGVFLLLMTLGMAFSGQVLSFDQDANWGLGIGASIASRVPIIGPMVVKLMLGGPIIAGATLSRFFTLHVFVIPGILIGFVALHVLMVLKLGINKWPMPGRIVKRATYEREYHDLTTKDGAPFVPYAIWKDLFFAVAACARYFGPFGPTGRPDPTTIQTVPKPDYFFLWLYALLSLLPPSMETPALFTLAMRSEVWHFIERASVLGAGLLFWIPIVQPWPSAAMQAQWWTLLYLFLATLPCDILSGFLLFSDRVVYPVYSFVPRHFGLSVLEDQECAAALMWTCVTAGYLIPAAILSIQLLSPRSLYCGNSVQSELPPPSQSVSQRLEAV
jgi:quinol-cytochrome oxidoreductase complex cytochrome b subunit